MQTKDKIIGYTMGTFDMFHVGHLNLIKNAKAHCDYLIVAVNSDELVSSYKNKDVIVPLAERMQIVQALKYVDQVVRSDDLCKIKAQQQHHFTKLFIGDDWRGSPRWEKTKQDMAELGAEVVFLTYTQNTSSTVLREKLLNLMPI